LLAWKVRVCELAEILKGSTVVSAGGSMFGGERAEVYILPAVLYLCAVFAVRTLIYALVLACSWPAGFAAITLVLRIVAEPQILSSVIKPVAVDVIDLAIGEVHNQAVHRVGVAVLATNWAIAVHVSLANVNYPANTRNKFTIAFANERHMTARELKFKVRIHAGRLLVAKDSIATAGKRLPEVAMLRPAC
jgi:hypothetical protein